jgi:hypothetical protein
MHYSYIIRDHYYYIDEIIELMNLVDIERRMKRDELPGEKLPTTFKEDLEKKMREQTR